jgi:hypothetical protein
VPEGWTRLPRSKVPNKDPTKEPLATFEIRSGEKVAQVTISRLPGNAGGLNFNIMRWRGQASFPKAANEAELRKELDQIDKDISIWTVDGIKMAYVDLLNPDKKDANRILGVVAERGSVTWFFKMQGPPDLVEQQKTAFKTFVESIRFGGTGANDG